MRGSPEKMLDVARGDQPSTPASTLTSQFLRQIIDTEALSRPGQTVDRLYRRLYSGVVCGVQYCTTVLYTTPLHTIPTLSSVSIYPITPPSAQPAALYWQGRLHYNYLGLGWGGLQVLSGGGQVPARCLQSPCWWSLLIRHNITLNTAYNSSKAR